LKAYIGLARKSAKIGVLTFFLQFQIDVSGVSGTPRAYLARVWPTSAAVSNFRSAISVYRSSFIESERFQNLPL
jgi:hypothetical protein